MKKFIAHCSLIVSILFLSQVQAQSLSLGLYGQVMPDYITPTLEFSYPTGDLTLGARAQRDAFGVSVESLFDLGPGGRMTYGARGSLGFAGWSLEGFAKGGLGPFALDANLVYASTPRANLWVGDSDPAGFSGLLAGRYRLSTTQTAGFQLSYSAPLLTAEATFALRSQATYTFGLGWRGAGPYGILGWRGEVSGEGALLEAILRAGFRNELETTLSLPLGEEESVLQLRLALAYALVSGILSGKIGVELDNYRLDASYDRGFVLWLRYTLNLGE